MILYVIMKLKNYDFHDLVEVRYLLELEMVKLAAERRTIDDIALMTNALSSFEAKVKQGLSWIEEDLFFHLKIADATGNRGLKSLMLHLTTMLLKSGVKRKIAKCEAVDYNKLLNQHKLILEHIINQNTYLAVEAMTEHYRMMR